MAYVVLTDKNTGKRVREEFNPELVEFRPPRVLDHGGKIIGLCYKGGQPLRLQTPEMFVPYGVSPIETPSGEQKYSVQLSFLGEDEDVKVAKFHEQMRGLQAKMIQSGVDNSLTWFKKKMAPEVVTEFFTPILKVSRDKETGEPNGKYSDTFKINLDTRNGEFVCKAFSPEHTPIDEPLDSLLTKGTRVTALVIPSFVWFAGGKFGVTIKAEQMRVKVAARTGGYGFVDDEEDVVDGVVSGGNSSQNVVASSVHSTKFVEDEDDDGDDAPDVPVAAPAPAPAPVAAAASGRRRVTRKGEEHLRD
jgi:hypothetical protein